MKIDFVTVCLALGYILIGIGQMVKGFMFLAKLFH